VQAGLDDVKRLIADLRPTALEELGLIAALERHASVLSADDERGVRVEVDATRPLPTLPSEVEVAAYRICLEALANAVRHGRATRVDVYLTCEDGHLGVRIEDDGIGLPDQIGTHGLGLASMAARASDVRGSCTVGRRSSGGTVVNARLPLTPIAGDQGLREDQGVCEHRQLESS
jgi:signal transduction histidine kinase